MEQWILYALYGGFFAVQLLSFLSRKKWVHWMPLVLSLVLVGGCLVLYGFSGNWGLLVLAFLLSSTVLYVAAGWLGYGLFCLVRKWTKKSGV